MQARVKFLSLPTTINPPIASAGLDQHTAAHRIPDGLMCSNPTRVAVLRSSQVRRVFPAFAVCGKIALELRGRSIVKRALP